MRGSNVVKPRLYRVCANDRLTHRMPPFIRNLLWPNRPLPCTLHVSQRSRYRWIARPPRRASLRH
ncbi:hypothetical protein BAUCODRAFT_34295 [Baudoinia panamericana UAMH 10762]|uniref:Uncharacterized protein n=1 Tax=Baudoinia panamericana (strain UAMH 10762) TaxID=717646 RepID=M2MVG7_BAUPA|nr:uncharacterized protein BAUCODRAFT_34295 [Baudoinia panamericana UAMH 10762]EMC95548.1 hypothetical protein BAUCODRAFT_34295 [Baudoinia panamericana UAMH 10762]